MTFYDIEMKSRALREKIRNTKPVLDIKGKIYYVSLDGDDSNDGLTPNTAWQTLERVNQNFDNFSVGDAVLFRCGDIFRGHVRLKADMTYSSFGEGEKPQLWASPFNAAEKEWKKITENVYSLPFPLKNDIGNIVFNHGEAWGYKKFESQPTINLDLDFYHDIEAGILYLYSESGNPQDRWHSIELCPRITVLHGNCPNNCTVDGLVIKYTGSHGIGLSSLDYTVGGPPRHNNIYNFTTKNCEFEWIGGSESSKNCRYGNGFEIWGGCDGAIIENCYFNQIYDAAITQQYQGPFSDHKVLNIENVIMRDNLIENSVYSFEYFLTEFKPGVRERKPGSLSQFTNILFDNNICRLCGYGFGNQRPDRYTPAHIKSWGHRNKSVNFVISNNIFDRADYRLLEIMADEEEFLPKLTGNVYCQYLGKPAIQHQREVSIFNEKALKDGNVNYAGEDATLVLARR